MEAERSKWTSAITDDGLLWEVVQNFPAREHDHYDNLIRAAFVYLERRIREAAGLSEQEFGKDLIDKAFRFPDGVLQPVSPSPAECAGLYHLLLGIFLYYRNPVAHRPIRYTAELARPLVFLVDHALSLVLRAVRAAIKLDDFVGPHEGQIIRRHDFRLDLDGDGEQELVILLELGPSSEDGKLVPHLTPIVLKKEQGVYRRLPADGFPGRSVHGVGRVHVRNITDAATPDLVVWWDWGVSSDLVLVLRRHEGRYVLARREIAPGTIEPYMGPIEEGFFVHLRQRLTFADVDGDGVFEIIQTLDTGPKEPLPAAADMPPDTEIEWTWLCRVLKWNTERERITLVEERSISGAR